MKLSDFSYQYPDELIATHPLKDRDASRMMVVDRSSNSFQHKHVLELPELLRKGDVLVINDTRVFPARLIGKKETGGQIEVLLLKPADVVGEGLCPLPKRATAEGRPYDGVAIWSCITNQTAKLRTGMKLYFIPSPLTGEGEGGGDQLIGEIISRENDEIIIQFNRPELIEKVGLPPLPPYIRSARSRNEKCSGRACSAKMQSKLCNYREDIQRYQTIYAEHTGSAAAPTAGLHLTEKLLNKIKEKGVHVAPVTLHVGLDTFSPVRVQNIKEHQMHGEEFFIPESSLKIIQNARSNGGRVIAVGTTSVRALESAHFCHPREETVSQCRGGALSPPNNAIECILWPAQRPATTLRHSLEGRNPELNVLDPRFRGDDRSITNLFIYPGYKFKTVDAILTNFHQPESTLIMMVSAFAGRDHIMRAYQTAINERYRLFSYGDCMLIV